MSSITPQQLLELCKSGEIGIFRKAQTQSGNYNYFITPNCRMELYGGKVKFIDIKYIVIEYNKSSHLSLLLMLKTMHEHLVKSIKLVYPNNDKTNWYPMHSETDTSFSIRCYLPQAKGSYSIESYFENAKIPFKLPRTGCNIQSASLDIRNIWELNKKMGYIIDLKIVKF